MITFLKRVLRSPKNSESSTKTTELSPRDLIKRERTKALKVSLLAIASTNLCLFMVLTPTSQEVAPEPTKVIKEFNREIIL